VIRRARQPLWAPALALQPSPSLRYSPRPTRWLEGGCIGAAVLGVGTYLLGSALCDPDAGGGCQQSQVMVAGATGAALGFVIGALIGGAIPKGAASGATPPN